MNNPWKLATLGLALTGVTALSTGLTTAYLVRPPSEGAGAQAFAAPAPAVNRPVVTRAVATAPVATQPVAAPVVRTSAVQPVADDCSTGGQRAMRVAKPGVIGALAGAGLGAIGGAIADGGSAAGKGALIGGIAGAALGGGYGAYKTKQECGTIFGSSAGVASGGTSVAPQTAFRTAPGVGDAIQIFNAR